ncbi:MAG: homoserine dehydrogenase [Nanoarchaeota archaeon]|nr:homoserine dehydrogenase [Nanoarchaeota archaeon]MBU1704634.1 homoserine dehydrogenase [Nanoarchaeota archaeon]
MTKIGLIGLGTIGSGVVKILKENKTLITARTGTTIELKRVCDLDEKRAEMLGIRGIYSQNYKDLLNDPDISTIVEVIGGYEPARTIIIEAIRAKKNVVTANKAVIAKHGEEIFKAAEDNNVSIMFEAAVGGCIPIIKAIRESFAADKINRIYGILNGTTNYILTKMEEGLSYDQALKQAQELGFAEANPSFDVDGLDSAQKLKILSSLAFNAKIKDDILTWGITKINKSDIKYAKDLGYTIKLLAIAKEIDDEIELRVHPTMIPQTHELANIKNESNAIYLVGNNIDKAMLYGKGAGSMPTATVVVGDIIDIAKSSSITNYYSEEKKLKDINTITCRYYLRPNVLDKPGVFAMIADILGKNNISISGVSQKELGKDIVPITIITHNVRESDMMQAVDQINKLDVVKSKTVVIRIEDI